MLEQLKKYAIIKDYILKKEKEIKESNSTIINDESNPVNIKNHQYRLLEFMLKTIFFQILSITT
jgi:hypothetical protein